MKLKRSLRSLRNDSEGATIVEFAIVIVAFFMLLMGVIEFGLYMMAQVTVESAVAQAARTTAIGTTSGANLQCPAAIGCSTRVQCVTAMVRCRTSGLPNSNSITISANTVASGGTQIPDICLDGTGNPIGSPSTCPPSGSPMIVRYQEVNGASGYQGSGGMSMGSGGSNGDLVELRVNYPWHVLFPLLGSFFSPSGVVMITSSTVVKNESF